jgi:hypothetical protein
MKMKNDTDTTLPPAIEGKLSEISDTELVQYAEELFLTLDREDSRELAYE